MNTQDFSDRVRTRGAFEATLRVPVIQTLDHRSGLGVGLSLRIRYLF